MQELLESVKTWGKWGPDDERGALNYITREKVARAAKLIADGTSVSCSLQFPTQPAPDNPRPAQHMMVVAGDAGTSSGIPGMAAPMDFIGVAFHGMAVSHIGLAGRAAPPGQPASGEVGRRLCRAKPLGVFLQHLAGGTGSPVTLIAFF